MCILLYVDNYFWEGSWGLNNFVICYIIIDWVNNYNKLISYKICWCFGKWYLLKYDSNELWYSCDIILVLLLSLVI